MTLKQEGLVQKTQELDQGIWFIWKIVKKQIELLI